MFKAKHMDKVLLFKVNRSREDIRSCLQILCLSSCGFLWYYDYFNVISCDYSINYILHWLGLSVSILRA
jgi:hypothetical protein